MDREKLIQHMEGQGYEKTSSAYRGEKISVAFYKKDTNSTMESIDFKKVEKFPIVYDLNQGYTLIVEEDGSLKIINDCHRTITILNSHIGYAKDLEVLEKALEKSKELRNG